MTDNMTDIVVNVKNGFCDKYLCDTETNFKNFLIKNANFNIGLLPVDLNEIQIVFDNEKDKIFIKSLSYGQNNVNIFDDFNNKLKEYHDKIRNANKKKSDNILSRLDNFSDDGNSDDENNDDEQVDDKQFVLDQVENEQDENEQVELDEIEVVEN